MRLALTLYDDNGSSEVTSVDCENFTSGCYLMEKALHNALTPCFPASSATTDRPVWDINHVREAMGDLEDLPTISC